MHDLSKQRYSIAQLTELAMVARARADRCACNRAKEPCEECTIRWALYRTVIQLESDVYAGATPAILQLATPPQALADLDTARTPQSDLDNADTRIPGSAEPQAVVDTIVTLK